MNVCKHNSKNDRHSNNYLRIKPLFLKLYNVNCGNLSCKNSIVVRECIFPIYLAINLNQPEFVSYDINSSRLQE